MNFICINIAVSEKNWKRKTKTPHVFFRKYTLFFITGKDPVTKSLNMKEHMN